MPVRGRSQTYATESGNAARLSRSTEKDETHSYFSGELAACLAALNSPPIPPPPTVNGRARTEAAGDSVSSLDESLTQELGNGKIGTTARWCAVGGDSGFRVVFDPEQGASRFGSAYRSAETADPIAEQTVIYGNGLRERSASSAAVADVSEAQVSQDSDVAVGEAASSEKPTANNQSIGAATSEQDQDLQPKAGQSTGAVADKCPSIHTTWNTVSGGFSAERGTPRVGRTYGSADRPDLVDGQAVIGGNGLGIRPSAFATVAMVSEAQVSQGGDAAVGEAASLHEPTANNQSIGAATSEQDQDLQPKVGQSAGAVADKYPYIHTRWDTVDGGFGAELGTPRFGQPYGSADRPDLVDGQAVIGGNGLGIRPFGFATVVTVSEAQVSQGSDAAVGEAASSQEPTVNSQSIGAVTGGQDQNLQPNAGQSAGAVADQHSDIHTTWDTVNGGFGPEQSTSRFGRAYGSVDRPDLVEGQAVIGGNGLGIRPSGFATVAMVSETQVSQGSDAAVGEAASSQEPTVNSRSIGAATGGQDQNSQPKVGQSAGAVPDKYPSIHTTWEIVNRPPAGAEHVVAGSSGDGSSLNGRRTERTQEDSEDDAVAGSGSAATPGSPSSASKPGTPLPTLAALELHPSGEAQGYRSNGVREKQLERTVTGMAHDAADEPARYGLSQWPATKTDKEPTERAGSALENNLKSRADASNRRLGNSALENVLPDGIGRVSNAEANHAAGHFHRTGAAQETGSYSLMGRLPPGPDYPALENAATLKVELEIGGSVRANIRERSGTVEVRMMTGDSQAARGLTGEADGLRSALGNSGLKLQSFEVSYHNDQRQRRPNQQRAADSRSHRHSDDEAKVFSIVGSNQ